MAINRVAVQTIIDTVPAKLRNAARAERQALIKETKKDPIAASFMAAKGEIPFFNNNKLQTELGKLTTNSQLKHMKQKQLANLFKDSHTAL